MFYIILESVLSTVVSFYFEPTLAKIENTNKTTDEYYY